MLRLAEGRVLRVKESDSRIQILEVELTNRQMSELAIAYVSESQRYCPGDLVLLNTTAVRLQLGTGGYHFVVAKLDEQNEQMEVDQQPSQWGHIMKMRYSPMQQAIDSVEEQESPYHSLFIDESLSLNHTPVLIGELHSLLPIAVLVANSLRAANRIAYVMPDGASLPIQVSRHVRQLKRMDLLSATVTTGHAWGGDFETVTIYTGLLAAKHVAKADLIFCFLGPGVAGTGTPLGFSGMQLAEVIHAVGLLHGIPLFVPRISFADLRTRHYGISHHSRIILKRFSLQPVIVPLPRFGDEHDRIITSQLSEDGVEQKHFPVFLPAPEPTLLEQLQSDYPIAITTMGRTLTDDPSPFQTAYLAALFATQARQWVKQQSTLSLLEHDARDILVALTAYLTNGAR